MFSLAFCRATLLLLALAVLPGRLVAQGTDPAPVYHTFDFAKPEEKKFVTISTGGFFGVYYPLGSALCKILNNHSADSHVFCSILRSSGSIMNIERLRHNEVNFAIVSSDTLRLAAAGSPRFEDKTPFPDLRGVMSLYFEHFAILAGKSLPDAKSFRDFKGRRLTIGPAGSDGPVAYSYLAQAYGLIDSDFRTLGTIDESHELDALCGQTSDGLIFVGGSPNDVVTRALEPACGAHLVPIEPEFRDRLLQNQPQLGATIIPGGVYPTQPSDVPTVGSEAVLVTLDKTDPALVTAMLNVFLSDMPALRQAHPVMAEKQIADLLPVHSFLTVAPAAQAALAKAAAAAK